MIVGAGALSSQKLAQMPDRALATAMAVARAIIAASRRVSRKAIAPGAISRPTARMMPTADSIATTDAAIIASIP